MSMRLQIDPPPKLGILAMDLDLVIEVPESGLPAIHVDQGQPLPDRHLLLGLAQCAAVATEEEDPASVEFVQDCSIRLVRGQSRFPLSSPLIIVRSSHGKFGVLAVADHETIRRLTRHSVRHFTGKIRLDVP